MRNIVWTLSAILLLPLHVAALEYTNLGLLYTDAPFAPAETAGISLLTTLKAVEGNPDGTFRPNRTLNRAEFLKIALTSSPNIRVSPSDAENCFPDVSGEDWFSRYICLAKKRDIVGGYPDGLFRPANPVNYAEALKILGELYGYTAYTEPDSPWYTVYVQAAANHKTALPINLSYDRQLTRGQMARLASAYRAEYEGELGKYRDTEQGDYVFEEPSSSSSSMSSVSSQEESSASSTSTVQLDIPTTSHLLQIGERSKPIADGRIKPWNGDAKIRIVEIKLEREVKSLEELYLLNEQGEQIATIPLSIYDHSNKTWKVYLSDEDAYLLPSDSFTTLAIEARLKTLSQGAISGEYVRVNGFTIIAQSVSDEKSITLIANPYNYPPHQTTLGRIIEVTNAGAVDGILNSGTQQLVGSFTISGSTLSTAPLRVTELTFALAKSTGFSISNWSIGISGSSDQITCAKADVTHINCAGISEAMGALIDGQGTFNLFASVELIETDTPQTLQVSLDTPGEYGVNGSVWWTDGTIRFTWVEIEAPLAEGTMWTIDE